ncbi:MAG TPA: PIN domain nuclease [Leptospiraceae bacterium]|nr:PIN domain nuclease [Leptospiraceae bacterium]HMW07342.1 PIN domain nuclease [Leptospiraceae bacterium]HMX33384.1 PIN domain nuclease [Leptospiraceae bacterium]HMY32950.1 PIN domain nuclease [Leptospiraceae bacterium]HMZ64564.1 PIN domain nuclease [Leptospiraceae bacterium]
MILVDTSVLLDYFSGNIGAHVIKFDEVLKSKIPFGINSMIYMEVLQGASSEKEFKTLYEYLETQKFYELKNLDSYKKAAEIYYKCRKSGITVRSTIDCLIVQTCIENKLHLLHNDKDFIHISKLIKELKFY